MGWGAGMEKMEGGAAESPDCRRSPGPQVGAPLLRLSSSLTPFLLFRVGSLLLLGVGFLVMYVISTLSHPYFPNMPDPALWALCIDLSALGAYVYGFWRSCQLLQPWVAWQGVGDAAHLLVARNHRQMRQGGQGIHSVIPVSRITRVSLEAGLMPKIAVIVAPPPQTSPDSTREPVTFSFTPRGPLGFWGLRPGTLLTLEDLYNLHGH